MADSNFLDQFLQQVGNGSGVPFGGSQSPQNQRMARGLATGQVTPLELSSSVQRQLPSAGRLAPQDLTSYANQVNPVGATPTANALMQSQGLGPAQPSLGASIPTAGAPLNDLGRGPFIEPQPAAGGFAPKALGPATAPPTGSPTTTMASTSAEPVWTRPGASVVDDVLELPSATKAGASVTAELAEVGAGIAPKAESAIAKMSVAEFSAATDFPVEGAAGKGAKMMGSIANNVNKLLPDFMGTAKITMGSVMTGLGVATIGLSAAGWVDSQNFGGENNNLDQGLSGGLTGASLGAGGALALGLGGGPVGWAALAGAALFGIGKMAFGDDDSQEDKINKQINSINGAVDKITTNPIYGVDAETVSALKLQVGSAIEFYKSANNLDGLKLFMSNLASTVPSFLMEQQAKQQANQQRMRLQASFGPVYGQVMTQNATSNQTAYDNAMAAANAIPDPTIRATLTNQANASYRSSSALNAAYASQVAASTTQLPAAAATVQSNASQMAQQSLAGMQQ